MFDFLNKNKEKKTSKYYVSYAYNGGFGATEIISDEPVNDIKTIREWSEAISKNIGEQVVIILWRKYG